MVRASDVSPDSVCFEDNFSVGSSDFPIDGILESGWYDTPPDTPRSVSPDILTQLSSVPFCLSLCSGGPVSKNALDRLILHCDDFLNPLHPKPASPVMWGGNGDSPVLSTEADNISLSVVEEISTDEFLSLIDGDSIFKMEERSKKRAARDEDMELKKTKARRTRDLLHDQADVTDSRRQSHSVLERKRRQDLKSCYDELRSQIPALVSVERASTSLILQRAVEYIESLKRTEEELLAGIGALAAESARLRGL